MSFANPPQTPHELLRSVAAEGERLVAWARIVVVSASMTRSVWVWSDVGLSRAGAGAAVSTAACLAALALSLHVVRVTRREVVSGRRLQLFALLDVLLCAAALSSSVVTPGPMAPGLAMLPDPVALTFVVLGSGMRLCPRVYLMAGAACAAALVGLVTVDVHLHGPQPLAIRQTAALVGLIAAATTAAVLMARRTRALVIGAAARARENARAGRELAHLGSQHVESTARLSEAISLASALARALSRAAHSPRRDGPDACELARRIEADLGDVRDLALVPPGSATDPGEEDRAPLVWVELGPIVREIVTSVARQTPTVQLEVRGVSDSLGMFVHGGAEVLAAILRNLVWNAAEGDGRRAAARVVLTVARVGDGRISATVSDDGPGIPAAVLARHSLGDQRAPGPTTKDGGSGLGLVVVARLAEESGGTLRLWNAAGGGAVARVELAGGDRQSARASGPPLAAHHVADGLISVAATETERVLAVARVALMALPAVWSVWNAESSGAVAASVLVAGALFTATVGYSVAMLVWLRHRQASSVLMGVSVTVDVVLSSLAIAAGALWLDPARPGALVLQDLGLLLLPLYGAGLRLSTRAVYLGIALGVASAGLIVASEPVLARLPLLHLELSGSFSLHSIPVAGYIALVLVRRTRRLMQSAIDEARAAVSLEMRLVQLARAHHDVRTLLTSARLSADLLVRSLDHTDLPTPCREAGHRLREAVENVTQCIALVKRAAAVELSLYDGPTVSFGPHGALS